MLFRTRIPRHYLVRLAGTLLGICAWSLAGAQVFHLHNAGDLANAKSAKQHFDAAALDRAVAEERLRIAKVLEDELTLVRRHTVARRNARLLYLIGEGDGRTAWAFLKKEIDERERALGLGAGGLQRAITTIERRGEQLHNLKVKQTRWSTRLAKNPDLPALTCPISTKLDTSGFDARDSLVFEEYKRACRKLTKVGEVIFGDDALIKSMKSARKAVKTEIDEARKGYRAAKKTLADAVKAGGSDAIGAAATAAVAKLKALEDFAKSIGQDKVVKAAGEKLAGLSKVKKAFDDFANASGRLEGIEAAREKVLAMLSAVAEAGAAAPPANSGPSDPNVDRIRVLAAMGKALARNGKRPPVSKLQIAAEQLRLDKVNLERRKAFFSGALKLYVQRQAAKREELRQLARVEQLRRQVAGHKNPDGTVVPGCLASKVASSIFVTDKSVDERCREKVFRLLVAYSSAWTLGRIPQEEFDYRLIGLHHVAALDASEVSFARWHNLLGVPIARLVDLHSTGIKPETISNIIRATGLGAIAAGVN